MSVLRVWSTITLLICSFLCDGIRGQDEPGFRNGKQQLQGMEHMTPAQWEDFKKSGCQNVNTRGLPDFAPADAVPYDTLQLFR